MKVLIVDDDFVSCNLLQSILSSYAVCHTATGGLEALPAIEDAINCLEPYDLICLDIMMPGMDGHQTLGKIRELEHQKGISDTSRVKVIMTTALGDSRNIMEAFIKGRCEGFITKPIEPAKFMKAINKLGIKLEP